MCLCREAHTHSQEQLTAAHAENAELREQLATLKKKALMWDWIG
jgi:hypothetical protein